MDRRRETRLFAFDGGVLEVYDYGDDAENGPGVHLELRGRSDSTALELRPIPATDDDTDTAAS
ncbi:hypothetical protein [Nocardia sp. NPDC051570]|uniref:hypothetical protein n=1 Tax=Nocardia sp. NPDC051570 TaxID=3364324 RepID=UPI0037A5360E